MSKKISSMILEIEKGLQNPTLRKVSSPILNISREIHKLARDMKASIKPHHGMGLAAPQVGKNVRMILINIPSEYFSQTGFAGCQLDQHYIIINPELSWLSQEQVSLEEGCLSLPDYFAEVIRPEAIRFQGLNLKGEAIQGQAQGIFARIIQHEIDHLNGIIFADKILPIQPKLKGKMYV